ncbi:MAG: hypothetical protein ACLFNX_01905 [Spirochaetaceae bacterium]
MMRSIPAIAACAACAAMLSLGLGAPLYAQEERDGAGTGPEAPEDTEIKLPELLLQVEEAELERVSAELPETAEARLGDVGIPLPTENELAISPAAFEVPGLDEGDAVETGPAGVSLYSDAALGVGSMNEIIGSLSLYRLGERPRFRLQFSHDGRDGYQFEEPGTGFFDRTEELSGWIEGGDRTTSRFEGGFIEQERGLQGQPTFFSTKSRFLDGMVELDAPFGDRYRFTPRLEGGYAERLRTGADESQAPAGAETFANPGVRVGVETTPGTFYADAEYLLRYLDDDEDGLAQALGLSLGADLLLGRRVSAGARVGVLWPFEEYVYVPFSLRLSATPAEALTLSVGGGMEAAPVRFSERWRETPTFATTSDTGDVPGWYEEWYADAGLLIDVPDAPLSAEVNGRVAWKHDVPDLRGYVPTAGETSYTLENRLSVTPEATMRWDVAPVGIEAGWQSFLLDRAATDPRHGGRLAVDIRNADETLGARGDLRADLYDDPEMPLLDFSAYIDVSEAVRISTDVLDVLSPLMPDGRARIGGETTPEFPFVEPGFRVVIQTRVSL